MATSAPTPFPFFSLPTPPKPRPTTHHLRLLPLLPTVQWRWRAPSSRQMNVGKPLLVRAAEDDDGFVLEDVPISPSSSPIFRHIRIP